jgi:hypothetical protein
MSNSASVIKTDIDDIGHQKNQKIFDVYNIYRLVLSLILLISSYFGNIISALSSIDQELFVQVMVVYTAFNIIVLFRVFLPVNRILEISQFISVILIDILFLILISYTFGGVSSGMAVLLLAPVASGSLIYGFLTFH